MYRQEKEEILFTVLATLGIFFIVGGTTFIHEMGHFISAVLLGADINQVHITLFDGGLVDCTFSSVNSHYDLGILSTIVRLSGGLAVALVYVPLGFIKRPFFIQIPIHLLDGLCEALNFPIAIRAQLLSISLLFVVITILHVLKVHVWDKEFDFSE